MPTSWSRSPNPRKALFALLLLVVAAAVLYAVLDNSPWNVPEAAKQMKNPVPSSDAALKVIRPLYLDKCAVCHGEFGRGDGHDAQRYSPRPTNFTEAGQLSGVTDGELFYKISEGHRPMPSFKKRLTEEQRWQLVLLLRSFAKP